MAHRRDQNRPNVFFRSRLHSPDRCLAARLLISGSLAHAPAARHDFRSDIRCPFASTCGEFAFFKDLGADFWRDGFFEQALQFDEATGRDRVLRGGRLVRIMDALPTDSGFWMQFECSARG